MDSPSPSHFHSHSLYLISWVDKDLEQLRHSYEVAQEQIAELRLTVDASADYETMIETLTEQNLEQAQKIEVLSASLHDLEQEQEMSEELDANQRQIIDELRRELDRAQIVVGMGEQEARGLRERLDDAKKVEEKFRR